MSSSLRAIGNLCNTPNRQHLKRFVDGLSYLIRTHQKVKDKYVFGYHVLMHDFFFDPNRCQNLYSTSLVLDECQKAIESLILDPNPDSYNDGLVYFFMPRTTPSGEAPIGIIANATHLLESARNGSHRPELLLFLKYLSKIPWFDRGQGQRDFTHAIVHWVCTTLVG